jgi:hypothetical protein
MNTGDDLVESQNRLLSVPINWTEKPPTRLKDRNLYRERRSAMVNTDGLGLSHDWDTIR